MATISPVFNYKGRLNRWGKGVVHIYCYIDGRKRYFPTDVSIFPHEWDNRKSQVSRQHPNYILLNQRVMQLVRDLEDYTMRIIHVRGAFTWKDLDEFTLDGLKASFVDFLREEIKADNTVAPSTKKFREYFLAKFLGSIGDIPFARVNYDMVDKYNKALVDDGLQPATVRKYHNQLKKFSSIAVKKGKIKESPYKGYRVVRPKQGLKKCLWWDDLEKLWNQHYSQDSMYENVRLKFLFSCYTGLRISDNNALKWDDIKNGKVFIQMKKTDKPVVVPVDVIDDRANTILEKAREFALDTVFKPMSDQVANRHLKRIGVDAKVTTPLNFHVSRHTFCTLVADKTGSVFKVMEYAGIYRIDTAMIYVNLAKLYS